MLTDNGKVFTGRFGAKDTEVLFDRICRENGIDHLLTAPRRPTTTGKIERFHRTLRQEFLTGRVFEDVRTGQAELDAWVSTPRAVIRNATQRRIRAPLHRRAKTERGPHARLDERIWRHCCIRCRGARSARLAP